MSFLDFLSVNGENQSLSIMSFQFEPLTSSQPAAKDYKSCSNVEATERRLTE